MGPTASMTSLAWNSVSEEDFAKEIDRMRMMTDASGEFISLLREQHPVYLGKGSNAVIRMRGYVIFSFTFLGLPDEALLFIYDELENGRDPYLLATSAIALRYYGRSLPLMATLLETAFSNMVYSDELFSFDSYYQQYPLKNETTARREILHTLSWLGACAAGSVSRISDAVNTAAYIVDADTKRILAETSLIVNAAPELCVGCCEQEAGKRVRSIRAASSALKQIGFENHEGRTMTFAEVFAKKTTLVAFFYSRCDNPLKCSLTITNMAAIQASLSESDDGNIQLVAITYDPFYDRPPILKLYAESRGLKLDRHTQILRTTASFSDIRESFDLNVNFAGGIVNRHAIELYIVGADGKIKAVAEREKMENGEIAKMLMDTSQSSKKHASINVIKRSLAALSSGITTTLFFFMPKCPFCFMAYLSFFGLAGTSYMPYFKYLLPTLCLIAAINIFVLVKMAVKRKRYLPLILSISGSVMVISSGQVIFLAFLFVPGLIMLGTGSLLNSLPAATMNSLKTKAAF